MADTDTSSPVRGAGISNPTGKEIDINATTALTAATHGGKTLEIVMASEDLYLTLYSCVGLTTKQKRIGIRVAKNSKRVKIYNAGTANTDQILELWLEPGAVGTLISTSATATGGWVYIGTGNIRAPVARRAPVTLDLGASSAVGIGSGTALYVSGACFVRGADKFAFTYEGAASDSINAVVGTYDSSKVITLGSIQTVRDTAAQFQDPALGPASGGGLVFNWRDSTNSKNEAAGATISGTTLSVGTVVDVNATTTNDPSAATRTMIIPDAGTANQLWMSNTGATLVLTAMSLSGNTLTIDGDNVLTGASTLGHIASPAANKCVAMAFASSRILFGYYQYSGGSVSLQWSQTTGQDTVTGSESLLMLSASKFLIRARNTGYIMETDQSAITKSIMLNQSTMPWHFSNDFAFTYSSPMEDGLAVDEDTAFILDDANVDYPMGLIDFKNIMAWNDDTMKDNRVRMVQPNHAKSFQPAGILGYNIHPTTKDILIVLYGVITTGGNQFAIVNLFETPRN